jgi:hypothetical protein
LVVAAGKGPICGRADPVGIDWPCYFGALPEDDARAFARWLSAKGLQVGEFMEVVDRAYSTWPTRWRGRPEAFIGLVGKHAATSYAFRKRRFAKLVAILDEAMASGALPGEIAPEELDLPVKRHTERRSVEELLAAVERVTHSRE